MTSARLKLFAHDWEKKFSPVDLTSVEADGTFSGYASLFGQPDLAGDAVSPGAFLASLNRRKVAGVKLLYQHNPDEPIGVWEEIREDRRGLFVKGRLTTEVARAREVLSLMRAGALDGLSIGFKTVKASRDKQSGIRHLHTVDLWEISIVTFPMLPDARVSMVKNRLNRALPSEREFERWLTRDAGLTRTQARAVIRSGFKSIAVTRDADGASGTRLIEAINRASRLMTSNHTKFTQRT